MANIIPQLAKEQELSSKTLETLAERPVSGDVAIEKNNKKLFFVGIIIFLLIIAITAWIYYLTTKITVVM